MRDVSGNMKTYALLIVACIVVYSFSAHANTECPGERSLNTFLKYHFPILGLTRYNESCSQIAEGDFNFDGRIDVAAVLTEIQPTETYATGDLWYKTYVLILLAGDLPYIKSQAVFVRTDGNKPKGVTVEAIRSNGGSDLVLKLKGYSRTRYQWSKDGFKAIKHSAD